MTMPPPYNPPPHNPYAGQVPPPQQPGPYGPPAPHGFPQQYPGAPQGQGAWGQPPMGPPPKKKMSTGAIVGIVLGSVVVVAGLGYAGSRVMSGADALSSFPEATHRLVVPKTLLDGEYELTKDASETEGKEVEETYDPSVKDAKAAIAQYTGEKDAVLVVSGFSGRLRDPEGARDAILKGAVDKQSTLAVPPKDFTPAGADVTVTCQVTRSKDVMGSTTLPMCAWGDDNTASFVAVVTTESATADPKTVDLAALAETTAKVRAEMRKPIGG
ncbi:hypothetical protein EAO71_35315 [Streptomyces sp. ms191]|uniref:hypothetical protein n=1 Tax=Streptomyces sp. ms191 TaxID=1827978 RepID=UPI0011CEC34D|nr:hypothetical protein [Streptomyces sp. ms191]TXS15991.1 hypothetical protein EAO71_35315 [Streptomyces sp. ms191]